MDADTCEERWRIPDSVKPGLEVHRSCRGISYYAEPGATGLCALRVYRWTTDGHLTADDALTGQLCPGLGQGGRVYLRGGLGSPDVGFRVTSPEAIAGGNLVVNGWVSHNQSTQVASGVIRAYDLASGAPSWAWDMDRPDRTRPPPRAKPILRARPRWQRSPAAL